jgi:glutamate-1-semialdehyde 2,1-aminomutase
VASAIRELGTVFGLPYALEAEAAERGVQAVPGIDRVRFANSGSEAVGTAVRLARAVTGRPLIVRFEGMYHGWMDTVYWSKHPGLDVAGPDIEPRPVPQGPGVPPELGSDLVILQWNDAEALEAAFARYGDRIAAVITEPVMCNTGCILPESGYLEAMREITRRHGALLIFDEVITGFRVALGGAQAVYGIRPDLSVFAKGLGGGFPVAALGGRRDVLALIDDGTVSMAGTYSGNGIAIAAATATLSLLRAEGAFDALYRTSERLQEGLRSLLRENDMAAQVVGLGPVFQVWFTDQPIRNYRDAIRHARQDTFRLWWEEMLARGVLFHPGPLENLFVSFAHTDEDIERTIEAAAASIRALRVRV